jgi:hypothetical protein
LPEVVERIRADAEFDEVEGHGVIIAVWRGLPSTARPLSTVLGKRFVHDCPIIRS